LKAIVCHEFGPVSRLRYEEVARRDLVAGEIRIAMKAAGLGFAEALKIEGLHQVKPSLPWIPGIEASGVVVEMGPCTGRFHVGERVMCVSENAGGCVAQEILMNEDRLFALPDQIGFEEAAALPVAYGTALYALRQRANMKPGESLLVLGAAGGTGLAAVQLGRSMGARVIAAASTPEKRELALRHGASHVVDYSDTRWREEVKALTAGQGVDVVYDPVGGAIFDEAIRAVAWMGRYLVVGFASGRIPKLEVNMPLLKGYSVIGVRYDVWRSRSWAEARINLEDILELSAEGNCRPPVTGVYGLERTVEALERIRGRQAMGKIVVING